MIYRCLVARVITSCQTPAKTLDTCSWSRRRVTSCVIAVSHVTFTFTQKCHNETLAKLSFVLALVECVVELAQSRSSPISQSVCSLARPAPTPPGHAPAPPGHAVFAGETTRSIEQLVLYVRALQLLGAAMELARSEIGAQRLQPSSNVRTRTYSASRLRTPRHAYVHHATRTYTASRVRTPLHAYVHRVTRTYTTSRVRTPFHTYVHHVTRTYTTARVRTPRHAYVLRFTRTYTTSRVRTPRHEYVHRVTRTYSASRVRTPRHAYVHRVMSTYTASRVRTPLHAYVHRVTRTYTTSRVRTPRHAYVHRVTRTYTAIPRTYTASRVRAPLSLVRTPQHAYVHRYPSYVHRITRTCTAIPGTYTVSPQVTYLRDAGRATDTPNLFYHSITGRSPFCDPDHKTSDYLLAWI